MDMYPAERQKEIISKFQELLKEADNFPMRSDPVEYRKFRSGIRGEGSSLLGLCNHLSDQLNVAADVISKMQEEKKNGTS